MTGPDISIAKRIALVVRRTIERFDAKGGWVMSSHIAMSMMLALFPFILFVVALASTITKNVGAEDLLDLVFGSWPEEISAPILSEMRAVLANADVRLMTVGGVLALYFASNGADAVRIAMTRAYRDTDPRPFWRTRLLSLAFVIGAAVLILVLAVIGLALPLYLELAADAVNGAAAVPDKALDWLSHTVTRRFLPLGLVGFAVTACHLWLPPVRHPFSHILPGVGLTLALWGAAGWGFSFYIARFSSYGATYAGLAGAMAALIFLYLMGAILILGAELNGVLIEQRNPDAD